MLEPKFMGHSGQTSTSIFCMPKKKVYIFSETVLTRTEEIWSMLVPLASVKHVNIGDGLIYLIYMCGFTI